jgi:hypothetical protein
MLLAPWHIKLLVLSLYHSDWYKKRRADQDLKYVLPWRSLA